MNNFHRFQNFRQFSKLFSQIRLKKRDTSPAVLRRSMQLAFQRRWWSLLSVALHNSIATALDPTLDIAEGTFPVASAIDVWVRDPPAVSSLPARGAWLHLRPRHYYTCGLEHDPLFSFAHIFLVFWHTSLLKKMYYILPLIFKSNNLTHPWYEQLQSFTFISPKIFCLCYTVLSFLLIMLKKKWGKTASRLFLLK